MSLRDKLEQEISEAKRAEEEADQEAINADEGDFLETDILRQQAKEAEELAREEEIKAKRRGVQKISCGGRHAAMVFNNGRIATWGSGDNGRLGHGDTEIRLFPTFIETIENAIDVSCGETHTIVLLENGRILSFGEGIFGQLGHGNTEDVLIPRIVNGAHHIISIACGSGFTIILDADGKVWSFGLGFYGQLGHGNQQYQLVPLQIEALASQTVLYIAAGNNHTAVITRSGNIFTFGRNEVGQLGHGNTETLYFPRMLRRVNNAIAIACGAFHTVIVLADGRVMTCGSGLYGKLGLGNEINVYSPQVVDRLRGIHIIDVACGQVHTVALAADGNIYVWGDGSHGQLGLGNFNTWLIPRMVTTLDRIVQIAAGYLHSAAIMENGEVYVWGSGFGIDMNISTPALV